MTRYYIYQPRDDLRKGCREYWHRATDGTLYQSDGNFNAATFTPAEAAKWVLEGYEKELIE